jgi:hypothetical protein
MTAVPANPIPRCPTQQGQWLLKQAKTLPPPPSPPLPSSQRRGRWRGAPGRLHHDHPPGGPRDSVPGVEHRWQQRDDRPAGQHHHHHHHHTHCALPMVMNERSPLLQVSGVSGGVGATIRGQKSVISRSVDRGGHPCLRVLFRARRGTERGCFARGRGNGITSWG